MFGVNGYEFMILLLVAVIVIGPTRLPKYAEQLAQLTKAARKQLRELKQQVTEETGGELNDIDWKSLDPRQYDPRRIVREALVEDQNAAARARGNWAAAPTAGLAGGGAGVSAAGSGLAAGGAVVTGAVIASTNGEPEEFRQHIPAPFDVEAT